MGDITTKRRWQIFRLGNTQIRWCNVNVALLNLSLDARRVLRVIRSYGIRVLEE